MNPTLSRRALLLGGVGLAAGACGVDLTPGRHSAKAEGSFTSAAMGGRRIGWTIAYPHGHLPGARLPVVISLHGRGGNHRSSFTSLRLDDALDSVVGSGTPAFAVAAVDGGDHSYWHRRTDGTDAGAMVRKEFVAQLADQGLDTSRLALFGWSMGGYGALLLAGKDRMPVRAVAVSSPALFTSGGATPAGAFDGAEDFDEHDVYGHPGWVRGMSVRVDCGRSDPFYTASRTYTAEVRPKPAGSFGAGGHDSRYWRAVAPAQLRFLGARLART